MILRYKLLKGGSVEVSVMVDVESDVSNHFGPEYVRRKIVGRVRDRDMNWERFETEARLLGFREEIDGVRYSRLRKLQVDDDLYFNASRVNLEEGKIRLLLTESLRGRTMDEYHKELNERNQRRRMLVEQLRETRTINDFRRLDGRELLDLPSANLPLPEDQLAGLRRITEQMVSSRSPNTIL